MIFSSPTKPPSGGITSPAKKHLTLLEACRQQNRAAAAVLVATLQEADTSAKALAFNAADPSGWNPLLYAARSGWSDIVEQCIAAQNSSSPLAARLTSSGNTGRDQSGMHGLTVRV